MKNECDFSVADMCVFQMNFVELSKKKFLHRVLGTRRLNLMNVSKRAVSNGLAIE